ncbi:unnamed protein product [Choristocarpus tenellus]
METTSDVASEVVSIKLSLKVHEVIKECQNQNGIRHGDYQRYRQYCSRRLKRVRSSRDVKFLFGKGKNFVPKELTADVATTSRHLEIPLMMAERAWAYAMLKKQESAKAPYRFTHHMMKRLSKAAKWAKDLEMLCAETADERSCLEASSYSAWMSGNVLLEKEAWEEALEFFSTAHRICEELGKVGHIEDQDLFTHRVEEMEPILRYCRYNIQSSGKDGNKVKSGEAEAQLLEMGRGVGGAGGGDLLAAKLESVLAEARKKQAHALDSVEWRGQRVPVRSEVLRVALVKADELAKRILSNGECDKGTTAGASVVTGAEGGVAKGAEVSPGQYLRMFGAYDEALTAIGEEAGRLQGKGGGAKMEAQRAEYEALRAYAQHHKLCLMLQRNKHLVNDLQSVCKSEEGSGIEGAGAGIRSGGEDAIGKSADIVHVYDALLQSLRAMIKNLGGGEDVNDVLAEEEDELLESARADEARYRAFRCFYVTEVFASREKWSEAAALFDHTRRLCAEAAEMFPDGNDDPRAKSLSRLEGMVEGAQHRPAAHALLIKARRENELVKDVGGLSISGRGGGSKGRAPTLEERLLEFDGGRKEEAFLIGDFPPGLRLMPCKPRLLDLAFDHLEFPDLDNRAGIIREIPQETGTGGGGGGTGIRGWVGWALGRG